MKEISSFRREAWHNATGIYVRAVDEFENWHSADIAQLTRESLIEFLEQEDNDHDKKLLAQNVIMILLGHKTINVTDENT